MPNGDYVVGKGLDDRAGLAIAIEVMRRLTKETHEADVMLVGAVQEEVGLRGAKTSSYKRTPDIAFAIDVTISNDQPGMQPKPASIGSGVSLSLFDASVISNPKLRKKIEDVAKKNKIPFTYDGLAAGGTDAGAIHLAREGVITLVLSIPSRYIHSHNSLVSLHDMQATVEVLVNFIKDFKKSTLNSLKK
jgi:endoglucanase